GVLRDECGTLQGSRASPPRSPGSSRRSPRSSASNRGRHCRRPGSSCARTATLRCQDHQPSKPVRSRCLETVTILRMLAQALDHEVDYIPRHARGQLDKVVHDFCDIKRAIRIEQRCFLANAALAIIDEVVAEPAARFPSYRMLSSVFVVCQLKGRRHSIRPEPHQKILLVRKEPPPRRLAFDLSGVLNLSQHPEPPSWLFSRQRLEISVP